MHARAAVGLAVESDEELAKTRGALDRHLRELAPRLGLKPTFPVVQVRAPRVGFARGVVWCGVVWLIWGLLSVGGSRTRRSSAGGDEARADSRRAGLKWWRARFPPRLSKN